MMEGVMTPISQTRLHNRLLRALSAEDFRLLRPHLSHAPTRRGDVIIEPNEPVEHVDFPEAGIAYDHAGASGRRKDRFLGTNEFGGPRVEYCALSYNYPGVWPAASTSRPSGGVFMRSAITLQPIPVLIDGHDTEGRLVLHDGQLVAVLARLDGDAHGEGLKGRWHLEAGFGPCHFGGTYLFDTLEDAAAWAGARIRKTSTLHIVPHAPAAEDDATR
jgi:hypothetical protein